MAIVEDDSGLRQQLESILKNAERTTCVGSYCSPEEALEDIFEAKPDVVLMHINLPGMSGIECVARLRKGLSDVHVIMLTIYEDSDRIFKALQAGADGYLINIGRICFCAPRVLSAARVVGASSGYFFAFFFAAQ